MKNKGWRSDYNLGTDNLKDKLVKAHIYPKAVHSDHCPVGVFMKI